jgi:hypothetical protein
MSEIQDVHHPEDQRQAGRHKKQKTSVRQTVKEKDDYFVHGFSFTCSSPSGPRELLRRTIRSLASDQLRDFE